MADAARETHAMSTYQQTKTSLNGIQSAEECSQTLKEIYSGLFECSHMDSYFDSSMNRDIFFREFYWNTLEEIVSLASKNWFIQYKKKDAEFFYSFFKLGDAETVFLGLTNVLNKASHSNVLRECVEILQRYSESDRFAELFWDQAKFIPTTKAESTVYDPSIQTLWNELIKRVISLPDRVLNSYKLTPESILWPKNFFAMIGKVIIKVLKSVHDAISASRDCSLGFLAQIFARLCIRNHSDDIYCILLPELEKMIKMSPLWHRICRKLFSSIDEPSLDAVIEPLLVKCKSYDLMYQLFGNFKMQNKTQLKYLVTQKYLFYRCYNKDTIPYCIIGYIKMCSTDAFGVLIETLEKLIDVWGSPSGIKHTSYEHHLYITKCILISIGFLRQGFESRPFPGTLVTALTMKLLDALPPHLESPADKLRILGMIVAEEITALSSLKDIQPLKFDFKRDDECTYLSAIARDPSLIFRHASDELEKPRVEMQDLKDEAQVSEEKTSRFEERNKEESELDSDDDLEPYQMEEETEEKVLNGVRPPVYLSECISGLLSKEDPSRLEACLFVAEKLVRRDPPELTELAVELVKILLYLQDNYDTNNFISLRHKAMVAATVKCPKKVISYLTTEFYEENYNLRQRMDILEVISASAQELSQPIKTSSYDLSRHLPLPKIPGMTSKERPEWQLVVEERIKSKTKIISHGPKNPEAVAVANEFSPVAGDWFFPLLKKFDSKSNTFDLLGKDFLVLGKLIQTLGTIIQASSGLSIARLMASAMFDLVWGLRYHQEPFVRQALLYSICMCLFSCSTSILITEFNSELTECHHWIADVASNDPDSKCRQIATQTLVLLDQSVKKECTPS